MKKHLTLDAYGAKNLHLDDIKYINDVLNRVIYELKLDPVTPPQLIPYYYGKVKEDIGVTAYMLLEGVILRFIPSHYVNVILSTYLYRLHLMINGPLSYSMNFYLINLI